MMRSENAMNDIPPTGGRSAACMPCRAVPYRAVRYLSLPCTGSGRRYSPCQRHSVLDVTRELQPALRSLSCDDVTELLFLLVVQSVSWQLWRGPLPYILHASCDRSPAVSPGRGICATLGSGSKTHSQFVANRNHLQGQLAAAGRTLLRAGAALPNPNSSYSRCETSSDPSRQVSGSRCCCCCSSPSEFLIIALAPLRATLTELGRAVCASAYVIRITFLSPLLISCGPQRFSAHRN